MMEERGGQREEKKLFALSTLPVCLMLLLHGVHLLLGPLLMSVGMSAVKMQHAHMEHQAGMEMGMTMGSGSELSWMTFILFMLNAIALYYAGRLIVEMWRNRKKRSNRAVWLRTAVSLLSLAVGVTMFVTM